MLRGQNNGDNKDDYRKAIEYYTKAIKVAEASPNSAHIAGSDQTNIRYLQDKLQ
jgi:hypothetical protein